MNTNMNVSFSELSGSVLAGDAFSKEIKEMTLRNYLSVSRLVCKDWKSAFERTERWQSLNDYKPFIRRIFLHFINVVVRCIPQNGEQVPILGKESVTREVFNNTMLEQSVWIPLAINQCYTSESVVHLSLVVNFTTLPSEDKELLINSVCQVVTYHSSSFLDEGPKCLTPEFILKHVSIHPSTIMAIRSMQEISQIIERRKKHKSTCEEIKRLIDKHQILSLKNTEDGSVANYYI